MRRAGGQEAAAAEPDPLPEELLELPEVLDDPVEPPEGPVDALDELSLELLSLAEAVELDDESEEEDDELLPEGRLSVL
ncbi:MAG TPA: hypothetical protein VE991_12325 [Acidimicrobiales bacterium]|nr:hypothetical protein [Acidimicrobiales bacterium]